MLKSSEKPEFKQKSAELSENPIERLRQIAGTREKTETQEQALPMTIGRMEEFHNFILKLSQDKFLGGDLPNYYSKFNEPPQRTTEKLYELAEVEDFCREFLNAKESLDSNTKRKLWEKIYKENWQNINSLIDEKKYEEASCTYCNIFAKPVHAFFDRVFVNVEDGNVRNNRLSLMKKINELYSQKIADLSEIVMPNDKPPGSSVP